MYFRHSSNHTQPILHWICTRLGGHYGLVAREKFPVLRVGPTPMSMELVIVYSYDSIVKVELVKIVFHQNC